MKFFFTFLVIFCASSLFAQDSTDTYYKIEGDSIFSKSINLKGGHNLQACKVRISRGFGNVLYSKKEGIKSLSLC